MPIGKKGQTMWPAQIVMCCRKMTNNEEYTANFYFFPFTV